MNVSEETVDIQTPDGPMATAVYRPEGTGGFPGVIIAHEAFGLTPHIMAVAKRLASEGYVTAAPDLFHRAGRMAIAPYDRLAEFRDTLRKGFSDDSIVADVNATIRYLKEDGGVDGPVGIVGFCMGGRVAYLAAARAEGLGAAVLYYGGNLVPSENTPRGVASGIDLAAEIHIPLAGFFGEEDANPSPEQVATLDEALTRSGANHQFHLYAGAGHGFFCDERESYRPQAAEDAWRKTLDFLVQHLKTKVPS